MVIGIGLLFNEGLIGLYKLQHHWRKSMQYISCLSLPFQFLFMV